MDEAVEIIAYSCPWPTEDITNDCILYRHVPIINTIKENKRRFPNETHFSLRKGEDGLSFNWGKYADEERGSIVIGLTKGRSGEFLKPDNYLYFKYPVSMLRTVVGIKEVVHNPFFVANPSPVGLPNNKSHALIIQEQEDMLSVRMDLADYCNKNSQSSCPVDLKKVYEKVAMLIQRNNDTEYHKLWDFSQSA